MTDKEIYEFEGYGIPELKEVIKELDAVNDILWEYISEKDYEEIRIKIEKIDDR